MRKSIIGGISIALIISVLVLSCTSYVPRNNSGISDNNGNDNQATGIPNQPATELSSDAHRSLYEAARYIGKTAGEIQNEFGQFTHVTMGAFAVADSDLAFFFGLAENESPTDEQECRAIMGSVKSVFNIHTEIMPDEFEKLFNPKAFNLYIGIDDWQEWYNDGYNITFYDTTIPEMIKPNVPQEGSVWEYGKSLEVSIHLGDSQVIFPDAPVLINPQNYIYNFEDDEVIRLD